MKIEIYRNQPTLLRGKNIGGLVKTFPFGLYGVSTDLPKIIEEVGRLCGGGMYQIKVLDDYGSYVKSQLFDIAGFPIARREVCICETKQLMVRGCNCGASDIIYHTWCKSDARY